MKASLLKRLEDLEARYKQDPLIVLASTDSGEEVKITMRECLEREDTHFIKVIAGANLQDLDLFLKAIREEAFRQVEGRTSYQRIKGSDLMKSLKTRLKTAEKKQEREPPFDLEGRYYDTLTQAEKRRYWKYYYGDSFTLEEAERLEVKHISGTLHFQCTLKPGDIPFPELDEWEAALDRTLDKILI